MSSLPVRLGLGGWAGTMSRLGGTDGGCGAVPRLWEACGGGGKGIVNDPVPLSGADLGGAGTK